jgi:hypothetical protein
VTSRVAWVWSACAAVLAFVPAEAAAHGGLVGRVDMPVPSWLAATAAAVVVALTFVALGWKWPITDLDRDDFRPLPGGRIVTSRLVEVVCGAVGVALLAVTVWAGCSARSTPGGRSAAPSASC